MRRAGAGTDFGPTWLPGRAVGGSVATGGLQVELDALRQRQRVGVVDRVGLAAHVGAPRVRTRLAAATGFLLAAERAADLGRSEEHTSELQSLMRISYAVFCLTKNKTQ